MSVLRWLDSPDLDSGRAATVAIVATVPEAKAKPKLPSVAEVATVAIARTPENREALAELRALIAAIGEREGWLAAEIEQAKAVALADHEAALACWRSIARECGATWPTVRETDERQTCQRCSNLTAGGRCLAAVRGELPSVAKSYSPVLVLRRCEGFAPLPGDADRRTGRERWPGLAAI
jgi:hypothetical protein